MTGVIEQARPIATKVYQHQAYYPVTVHGLFANGKWARLCSFNSVEQALVWIEGNGYPKPQSIKCVS